MQDTTSEEKMRTYICMCVGEEWMLCTDGKVPHACSFAGSLLPLLLGARQNIPPFPEAVLTSLLFMLTTTNHPLSLNTCLVE